MKKLSVLLVLTLLIGYVNAQNDETKITTAVPFLTITPDARSGAMGDIGAATSADASSIFHNPAKYSFAEKKMGLQISYSPWLSKIANDMSINYLSGYYKINDNQAFAASLKYFSIGEITFTNELGEEITAVKPNEFALSAAYSMKLTENFSGAIGLKFIYSNITGGVSSYNTHAGYAAAGDLAFFYNKPFSIKNKDATFRWGLNLSNLGTKVSYGTYINPFIPANLRTGLGFKYFINEFNSIEFGLDFNKLLVPTPPIYDGTGTDDNNIIKGKSPNVSTVQGMIQSFYDAPNGMKEELHEIMTGVGAEYSYNNVFLIRAGVFYENKYKGGRRYFTTGLGFRFKVFNIDFSYLAPIKSRSPLESTLRFTLSFYFDKI